MMVSYIRRSFPRLLAVFVFKFAELLSVSAAQAQDRNGLYIEVSIEERQLRLMDGNRVLRATPVTVGSEQGFSYRGYSRRSFATPTGEMRIVEKVVNPEWVPPEWRYVELARSKGWDWIELRPGSRIPLRFRSPAAAAPSEPSSDYCAQATPENWIFQGVRDGKVGTIYCFPGRERFVATGPAPVAEPALRSTSPGVRESDVVFWTVRGNQVGLLYLTEENFIPIRQNGELFDEGRIIMPPIGTINRRIVNALGPYALRMARPGESYQGYMIHGTNDYNAGELGQAVSHGCIRVSNDFVEYLYRTVPVGTPVYIVERFASIGREPFLFVLINESKFW